MKSLNEIKWDTTAVGFTEFPQKTGASFDAFGTGTLFQERCGTKETLRSHAYSLSSLLVS
jgi:hypothetical protein